MQIELHPIGFVRTTRADPTDDNFSLNQDPSTAGDEYRNCRKIN